MLENFKQLIDNQYEAAFCTLNECIVRCPDELWQAPVAQNPYSQSVFHALFYADLYLGENMDVQPKQDFHQQHAELFGDYEQLEDRKPTGTYDKPFLHEYLEHCRNKAKSVVSSETSDDLHAPSGFSWLKISRAEVHVYNIRHIQHHAAQLILRLRIDTDVDMPWVRSGWQDF